MNKCMESSRYLSKLVVACGDEAQYLYNLVLMLKYVDKEINVCTEIIMMEPLRFPIMSSSKNAYLSSEQDSFFLLH